MSAVGNAIFNLGANAAYSYVLDAINTIPQGKIGGVAVQTTLEETATDTIEMTEQPVESGASITDHAYVRPCEVIMRCGWSNAVAPSLQQIVSSVDLSSASSAYNSLVSAFIPPAAPASSFQMSLSDYVSGIYSQLLGLQAQLTLLNVTTSIRYYQNMLIKSLTLKRDKDTSQALMVEAHLRQIIIVSSSNATTVPITALSTPANNAATLQSGTQNLSSAVTPTNGGSLPMTAWTAP